MDGLSAMNKYESTGFAAVTISGEPGRPRVGKHALRLSRLMLPPLAQPDVIYSSQATIPGTFPEGPFRNGPSGEI